VVGLCPYLLGSLQHSPVLLARFKTREERERKLRDGRIA